MRMGLIQKINLTFLGRVRRVSISKKDCGTTTVGPIYGFPTTAGGAMFWGEYLHVQW